MPDPGASFADIFLPVLFIRSFQFIVTEGQPGFERGDIGICQEVDLVLAQLGGYFRVNVESLENSPPGKEKSCGYSLEEVRSFLFGHFF